MNMSSEDCLILVHEDDRPAGKPEKTLVHQLGLLHRAFSVFIFNSKGELLLQQRAVDKYHSGGLWTNTRCGHPRFGEEVPAAVERRLMEEMGIKCETRFQFSFMYKAKFENGLKEHEYDHVYYGITDDVPVPEESEVQSWKFVEMNALEAVVKSTPNEYTTWLKKCMDKILLHFQQYERENNLPRNADVPV